MYRILPRLRPPLLHATQHHVGGMGLISKAVVLSRNYDHPGVCLEITPTHLENHLETKSFPEACQRLEYSGSMVT